jgi:uncharacterized cupin superfamily protein
MENVFSDAFDLGSDQPGFSWNRIQLARRLGGDKLGASVFELPPGQRSFPYHFHHANEELLLVLSGEVVLRTPDGTQTMGPGDAELFQVGAAGAHQVSNESAQPARFIMFSTMVEPEIAEYPDSGNVGVFAGRAPGAAGEATLWRYLDGAAERDYFHGEDSPPG